MQMGQVRTGDSRVKIKSGFREMTMFGGVPRTSGVMEIGYNRR